MKGARCKYSEEGRREISRSPHLDRLGTIVGESRDKTCWYVRWDGVAQGGSIHKSFITILES